MAAIRTKLSNPAARTARTVCSTASSVTPACSWSSQKASKSRRRSAISTSFGPMNWPVEKTRTSLPSFTSRLIPDTVFPLSKDSEMRLTATRPARAGLLIARASSMKVSLP